MSSTKGKGVSLKNDDGEDDEDEEDDDDYDPTKDQEALEEDAKDNEEELKSSTALDIRATTKSSSSYPAVDQAFEELFGYPWGTTFLYHQQQQQRPYEEFDPQEESPQQQTKSVRKDGRLLRRNDTAPYSTNKNNKHKKQHTNSKNEFLLTQLFGRTAAMKLLHAPVVLPPSRNARQQLLVSLPPLEVSLQQGKRALMMERRRFAGVDILLQQQQQQQQQQPMSLSSTSATPETAIATTLDATTVLAPTLATTTATTATTTSLDQVLQELAGPSKVSTVAKTSADWDVFKTQHATTAEVLEERAQGKDAFLVKQDFLSRVDGRRFEQEKAQRDTQRGTGRNAK
jgi:hypothetical protein